MKTVPGSELSIDVHGIFVYALNGLNLSTQERSVILFKVEDLMKAIIMRLDMQSEHLQKGMLELFPTISDFRTASNCDLSQGIRNHSALEKFGEQLGIRSSIFWDVTPCSLLKVNRHFEGTYCLLAWLVLLP
jgi:hypothetical protein